MSGEAFAFFRWHCVKYKFFSHHISVTFNRCALDDWRHGYR